MAFFRSLVWRPKTKIFKKMQLPYKDDIIAKIGFKDPHFSFTL